MLSSYLRVLAFIAFVGMVWVPVAMATDGEPVNIRIAVDQKYDDNVTYSNTNPKSDYITALKGGVTFKRAEQNTRFQIGGDIIQEIFWDETNNSNTSEFMNIRVEHELSKTERLLLEDTFSHTYDPTSFEEESERVGGRFSFYRNSFDVLFTKDMAKDFGVSVGYGNDADVASRDGLTDSYVNRLSLEGTYALSTQSTVFGVYEFLHRKLEPGGAATIHTLSTGVRQSLTEKLSVEGRVGVDIVDSYNGETIVKPLWRVTVQDQINERTSANITMQQRHSTNPFTSDVFNSWSVSGGLQREFTKKLDGGLTLFYSQGEFNNLAIEEEFVGVNAALNYLINKDWQSALAYGFSEKMATQEGREYDKNTVTLTLKREF